MIKKFKKFILSVFGKPNTNKSEPGLISKLFIAKFLPPNPVIVEAGAHIGLDTVEWAELFPDGMIYAFEPIPSLYEQLVARTKNYQNVRCFPTALGVQNGTVSMFVSSGTSVSSSSVMSPKEHLQYHPQVRFDEQITVPCITLDDWFKEQDIPRVDFLWLDLQGYELHVLKSAEFVLEKVSSIYTEVNLMELYEGAPLYDEVRVWVTSKGFHVVSEALPWADAGNVLFVRNS